MKLSVFTPTHDARWLSECHASLRAQSYADFEWVVVPNGKVRNVPPSLTTDPRVRVVPASGVRPGNIGAVKRFAASHCSGDVLVELDHDDLLAPECLAAVARAARDGGPGFYYSDFVSFRSDHTSETYAPEDGWETYPTELAGRPYTACRAFEVSPRALSSICFAPNHVRAWHRETYYAAGGHDPSMPVADDYDLLCRTYLSGAAMVHIPRPLYHYRRRPNGSPARPGNTFDRPDTFTALHQAAGKITNTYLHRMVLEWCRRRGLQAWDVDPLEGTIPLREPTAGYTHVLGLAEDDPGLRKSPVGAIRVYDVLDLLPAGKLVPFVQLAYKLLADGGWLLCASPSTDGRGAFANPNAGTFVNEATFWAFTHRGFAERWGCDPQLARFQAVRLWTEAPSDWHRANNWPYVYADLMALKETRWPGREDI